MVKNYANKVELVRAAGFSGSGAVDSRSVPVSR